MEDDPARAAETILTMVAALSAHDRHTRGHSERVRAYTDLLAASMKLPEHDRDRLRWAALLHDIGKLEVEARILNKPGKPLPHEWDSLKRHPEEGARLAAPLLPWLGAWGLAIEQHHERFDGRGYPRGLAGAEISLGGRILTVTDSFETMTAARSYKRAMSVVAARQELANCAGSQFDPVVVRAFLNVSLGRLWWKVGPMSWLAQLPFIRLIGAPVVTGARTLSGAATKAAVGVVALGVGGTLHPAYGMQQPPSVSGTVGSIASAAHQSKADQASGPGSASEVGSDEAQGGIEEAQDGSGAGDGNGGGGTSDETSGGGGGDPVGDAVENVKDTVENATGAVDGVGDVAGGIGGAAQGAGDAVDGATDAVNDAVNDAQDAVDGLLP